VPHPPVRRIVLLLVAIIVAGVCTRLGFWQLDRLQQRRAYNAAVRSGISQPPLTIGASTADLEMSAYRHASAEGRYYPNHEMLLYGRSLDGAPGSHVLTPLLLGRGRALLVDRGWVPLEQDGSPLSGPSAAPAGRVRVTGVLLPADSSGAADERTTAGIVRTVDIGSVGGSSGLDLLPEYLLLETQDPAQPAGIPAPAPLPELSEGPHLSYAIQWFVFATIALVGYGVLLLRDRWEDRAPDGIDEASGERSESDEKGP
jgi:surfeit locus 1 family protein